jgi:hypothetical protein
MLSTSVRPQVVDLKLASMSVSDLAIWVESSVVVDALRRVFAQLCALLQPKTVSMSMSISAVLFSEAGDD